MVNDDNITCTDISGICKKLEKAEECRWPSDLLKNSDLIWACRSQIVKEACEKKDNEKGRAYWRAAAPVYWRAPAPATY
jgi:hypothetical protein